MAAARQLVRSITSASVRPVRHVPVRPGRCHNSLISTAVATHVRRCVHQGNFYPRVRNFSTSTTHRHGHLGTPKSGEERKITFIDKEGDKHTFTVADGDNLLDIAQANDLEMEGACGGSCACSTCHVIVSSEDYYDKLPEPTDDENDMLDLAFGLTETSRLGCQVQMSPEVNGLEVKLPSMTRNMQASDFSKKD